MFSSLSLKKSLIVSCLLCSATSAFAQKPHAPEVQAKFDRDVATAVSSLKLSAKPQKQRRLLVLSKAMGWYHGSIETAKTAMRLMAKQTGAFTVDFNDDPNFYTSNNLNNYDAILFNNTTYVQDLFNTQQRQAVLSFVKNGGGFIGIHAAADCGTSAAKAKSTWPEITKLIGGAFDGHPWAYKGTHSIRVEDPINPIISPYQGQHFTISDELYKYKDYDRKNQRVLLSVNMLESYRNKGRDDHDNALLWVKSYGKGRVFFSTFGHNEHIYANAKMLQVWLNGIQFSIGDLDAEIKPLPFKNHH